MDSNDEHASDSDDEESDAVNSTDDDFDYLDDKFSDLELERKPSRAKKQQETADFKYEVLSADQIVQFMVNRIEEVIAVVQIPSTITRILLNHFKWDKEKLMERYNGGGQDSLFAEVHVFSPCRRDQGRPVKRTTRSFVSTSSDNTTCEICLEHKNTSDTSGMECGHKFCSECWRKYLTSKIKDKGMGHAISCAAYDCDILVDDVTVMKSIHDPKAKLKYQKIITKSFVECNRLLCWCPAPDCGHAVKVAHYDTKPVTCKCGHTFCFACGENWHDPVKCFWLKKWIKKCDDDSETAKWFDANTKCNSLLRLCPALDCSHAIQDTESITSECGHIFCFACGENWHNPVRLDGPSERRTKSVDDSESLIWMATNAKRSRDALGRYRFYWSRYMNHMRSLKFKNKLYHTVQIQIKETEVQFLKKAMDVLSSCRQTLMYNYVFTFYLKTNNQSIIFKNNQKDLEYATEQLSEYLEGFISSKDLQCPGFKEKVERKTRYCEQRRKVLLEHVHEGYEKDYWEYQEDL